MQTTAKNKPRLKNQIKTNEKKQIKNAFEHFVWYRFKFTSIYLTETSTNKMLCLRDFTQNIYYKLVILYKIYFIVQIVTLRIGLVDDVCDVD